MHTHPLCRKKAGKCGGKATWIHHESGRRKDAVGPLGTGVGQGMSTVRMEVGGSTAPTFDRRATAAGRDSGNGDRDSSGAEKGERGSGPSSGSPGAVNDPEHPDWERRATNLLQRHKVSYIGLADATLYIYYHFRDLFFLSRKKVFSISHKKKICT